MARGGFGQGFVTMGCCGAVLGHPHEFGCTDGAPCPDCQWTAGEHADDCPTRDES